MIDAHQHFWRVDRGDYFWMPEDPSSVLRRDYGPADLKPLLDRYGITGTVLVQAAPTEAETAFMLDIAAREPSVKAVVGWVDFERSDAPERIAELAGRDGLVGVRPMIQDLPDDDWMLRDDLAPAFQALIDHGLRFDALTFPRHLPRLLTLIDRWPDLKTVVDHCSKPQIRHREFQPWADHMRAVAEHPHIVCKLSGVVTETDGGWTVDDIRPYVEHVVTAFGAERVMWGSDWPVVNVAGGYERWREAAEAILAGLPASERAAIFGGTAARFYGFQTE